VCPNRFGTIPGIGGLTVVAVLFVVSLDDEASTGAEGVVGVTEICVFVPREHAHDPRQAAVAKMATNLPAKKRSPFAIT
jgi:hypothetical protein